MAHMAVNQRNGTDADIDNRLNNFNCEWLSRPGYVASEFLETLAKNWPVVNQKTQLLLTESKYKKSAVEDYKITTSISKHKRA